MGREKTTSKRFVRNPKQKSARRPALATMSAMTSQQNGSPHQGPSDYDGFTGEYDGYTDDYTPEEDEEGTPKAIVAGELTHERARELIVAQTTGLLPPADANALADHLLICDACYRYAQDVAAQRRNASANP